MVWEICQVHHVRVEVQKSLHVFHCQLTTMLPQDHMVIFIHTAHTTMLAHNQYRTMPSSLMPT